MNTKRILLIGIRILLIILILANMALIFSFSMQTGKKANEMHEQIGESVLGSINQYPPKDNPDHNQLLLWFRKFGHFAVFGTLGALSFLLLLTWKNGLWRKYLAALGFTLLYAISDEVHQLFVEGRAGRLIDVGIDFAGALILCTAILFVCFLVRRETRPLKLTRYTLKAPSASLVGKTLAVASDLHGNDSEPAIRLLKEAGPNVILIPGDLMDDAELADPEASGYAFLRTCASLAPTYYSIGNHEIACYHKGNPWRHPVPVPISPEARERIEASGAVLLDNACVTVGDVTYCGLTSGINRKENHPDAQTLARFASLPGVKLLLCHHPEYFVPYIQKTDIDLTVSGHAHGGHWRILGRGIYAPGQGLFPKYTSGILDGRCVISRGMGNHTRIPRMFNDPELVLITFE